MSEELPELIHTSFPEGVAILGAGAPTVDLLYYTGMEQEIRTILTTDKSRYGAVLASTSMEIRPLEVIEQEEYDGVLVSSDRRQEELIARLSDFREKGGRVIRFSPQIEVI